MKKSYPRKSKRHFLLLEVLISFVLVVMSILPMISTHAYILKSQYNFINKIELDHVVSLMYGEVLERLYQNRIAWNDIESERVLSTDELLQTLNYAKEFPYKGTYRFKILKFKPPDPAPRTVYLVELIFTFVPKGEEKGEKPLEYPYLVFMERNLKEA